MKKIFRKLQKIQWQLTFTYMVATLLMLFLVELLVLVSNNRDAFSNPFFINSTARLLTEASCNLGTALDQPYDNEAINEWILISRKILQSNTGAKIHPVIFQPPAEDQPDIPKDLLKTQQISLFDSKPVPFSQEKSFLIVTDLRGIILGSDDEGDYPLGDDLFDHIDEEEVEIVQDIISGSETNVVYANSNIQYASFAFPVKQNGESKAIVFMRIAAPTIKEELQAALEGFLPDLPIFLLTSIIVGFVFGSVLASSFTTRIRRLIEYTTRWGKGDFARIENVHEGDEISELSIALNQMVDQFEELIESKKMLAVLEERNRFARDLHDSVKQEIFSISMNLSAIKSLIKKNPDKALEQIKMTADIAKQARNELSALIYTLLPAQLENQDLEVALKEYINVWEKNSGISVVYRTHGSKVELPEIVEQSIFRITQEALANIARHSKATATSVTLDYQPTAIALQISDNGTGFDIEGVKKGLGLRSIAERVSENRGKLDVDSGMGGTTITLRFPYEKTDKGELDEKG